MTLFRFILLWCLTLAVSAAADARAQTSAFKAVRPVLEANCVECHGGKSIKGGLRITTREDLLKGSENGEVISSGNAEASLLYKKVTHADDPGMPFKREKLSNADIAKIAAWIKAGVPYDEPLSVKEEQFWSLKPLQKPALPKIKNKSWPKTPIDQFVLSRLEEKKLKPSAAADKRTLLRRVTFDLIGLPPTPAELEDFLKDKSPTAFEKVVDRLLASPRYGERWARHWLDVVHYGDSHGHDEDALRRNAWPYRDYVIRSFNDDKPYARFVEEQLAGDVLFPEDPNGIVATGFIVSGPWDQSSLQAIMEDTVDKKIARYIDRDDMVMTAISTFASSTVHCARCHNHKFDPIPQTDYYNLQAVFAGVDRTDRPYDLDVSTNAYRQALLKKKTALDIKDPRVFDTLLKPDIQAKVVAWEKTLSGDGIWTVLDPTNFTASSGATLTKQTDFSLLASGEDPLIDTYTITAHTDLKNITAFRLEVLTDSSHSRNGPGRNPDNGNFHLSEIKVSAAPTTNPTNNQPVVLQNPTADFNQENWTIDKTIDGDTNTAWGIHPETGKPHLAFVEFKENLGFDGGTTLIFSLQQLHGRKHTILRPRISVTTAPRPLKAPVLPGNIRTNLAIVPSERTDEQKRELAAHVLKEEVEKEMATLPKPQLVYAAANDFTPKGNFIPAKKPREIHLLKRGDINKPADLAVPGALSCVPEIPSRFDVPDPNDEGARRAALAKWITHPKNVLAWRSIVNRVWHYHFGKGIVDTPNDFGLMGSQPTHPELLDWLAIWFQENNGSFKKLHKLILSSAVYQQSCENNKRYAEVDAGNSYLWRMNRTRLDAESVRDGVLQITGKIDLTMGGPSVTQFHLEEPNPSNTPVVDYNRFDVDSPNSYRRSIYRMIVRSLPDPFMDTLDCADASQLTATRNVSMTALQALAMWNNAFIVRQSEHLAARVRGEVLSNAVEKSVKEKQAQREPPISDQIKAAYQLALGREPSSRELKDLAEYAKQHGMANTCRLILNSNEFMFVN